VERQREDLDLDWFTPFSIVFTIVLVEIARKTMGKGKEWSKYPKKSLSSGNWLIRSYQSKLRHDSIVIKMGNPVIIKIPLQPLMLEESLLTYFCTMNLELQDRTL